MKKSVLLLVIFSSLFFSCNYFKKDSKEKSSKPMVGSWRLFDIENKDKAKEGGDKLLNAAKDKEYIKQGIILSFFEDGTYTEIKGTGEYKYGKWKYDNVKKQLSFLDSTNTPSVTVKEEVVNNKPTISLEGGANKQLLKFILSDSSLKDYQEDPFYAKNNYWRIKPSSEENPKQLEKRLSNYFKHLVYILKAAKERKSEVVSFEFSQGIVRIYNGGIGILPENMVPETWVNTYYNSENAYMAYKMFEHYLMNNSYKGAGIGNWIEDDYNILLSIYGDVEAGKLSAPLLNSK